MGIGHTCKGGNCEMFLSLLFIDVYSNRKEFAPKKQIHSFKSGPFIKGAQRTDKQTQLTVVALEKNGGKCTLSVL